MLARGDIAQGIRARTEIVVAIVEVRLGADQTDLELTAAPALPDARVEDGGLLARVGAHDQQRVAVLDAGDGRRQDIRAPTSHEPASLAALNCKANRAIHVQQI